MHTADRPSAGRCNSQVCCNTRVAVPSSPITLRAGTRQLSKIASAELALAQAGELFGSFAL